MLSVKPGENDRLCAATGVLPIRLEPGGAVRLNPLDPGVRVPRRLRSGPPSTSSACCRRSPRQVWDGTSRRSNGPPASLP